MILNLLTLRSNLKDGILLRLLEGFVVHQQNPPPWTWVVNWCCGFLVLTYQITEEREREMILASIMKSSIFFIDIMCHAISGSQHSNLSGHSSFTFLYICTFMRWPLTYCLKINSYPQPEMYHDMEWRSLSELHLGLWWCDIELSSNIVILI